MRLPWLLIGALALGCGDDGGGEGTEGTGSTSAGTTSVGSTGTTGGSADATATAADTTAGTGETTASTGETTTSTGETAASTGETTTGPGTTSGATTGDATTGGTGMLDAQLSTLQIFQDCMPIVPPDPVGASASLALDNLGDAPVSATVTSAAFLDAGGMQVATLDVVPAAFGPIPAGGSDVAAVSKAANSLVPAGGCEVLQCGAVYTLELVLDADGTEVVASTSAPVDCVF